MEAQKKITILIALAGVVLLTIIILIMVFQMNTVQEAPIPGTTPTQQPVQNNSLQSDTNQGDTVPLEKITVPPFEGYSEEYQQAQEKIYEENKEMLEQQNTAASLRNNIPLVEESFSLDYDYSTFEYVLTLPRDNQTQGIKDFEDYLEENGIEDPSWLKKLRIETVSELKPVEPQDEAEEQNNTNQQNQNTTTDETEDTTEISEEELLEIESL